MHDCVSPFCKVVSAKFLRAQQSDNLVASRRGRHLCLLEAAAVAVGLQQRLQLGRPAAAIVDQQHTEPGINETSTFGHKQATKEEHKLGLRSTLLWRRDWQIPLGKGLYSTTVVFLVVDKHTIIIIIRLQMMLRKDL
jgi:hypothetical protein